MSILIRKMQRTDSDLWAAMRSRLWDRLSFEEHSADIERLWNGEKGNGYIAQTPDRTAVGFAEISIRDYANGCTAQPVPFLEGIWIDPNHRRNGIGRLLITNITDDLIVQGFHELCSDADVGNRRSHQAHKNWEFSETARVVYFRKPLC
ncbi:GNAT family N-acetyltransferase [Rhizobium sp. VS19-DR104.2]|uniref:GNAT family N-acetyltransferase n=1 Tax=unclassified Rhizobium TaxID=2613769 RepID=UPI001C5BCA45|nr:MULTISPECIES: GNAT family N-acetyltransferase [unclassified Rhizobium]MBZ5763759.1 GNAT family N-acetyltransferase [Rhizobium sp. VS19-DR96]MBZ5769699.1 GNAT family N-acetyltransferase [Rhizobium sp. VS19-DR129.2]MBZ5777040.1 GNAT family N-acetyltransferase [Rhizobium sp. VS19-DRK62.2]MBZ5788105.1 GNAT family N-acetyltransferase [Rhizobium sp. VS19-DR121]MBZ5805818.1 GNAT family N-acetyltransferase [Rhizobium sp. VS19-DR181]